MVVLNPTKSAKKPAQSVLMTSPEELINFFISYKGFDLEWTILDGFIVVSFKNGGELCRITINELESAITSIDGLFELLNKRIAWPYAALKQKDSAMTDHEYNDALRRSEELRKSGMIKEICRAIIFVGVSISFTVYILWMMILQL